MDQQDFASVIRRTVAVNDFELASAIEGADLAEAYDVTELPEDPDENTTTQVEIHEELVDAIHLAAEDAARDIYEQYAGDD